MSNRRDATTTVPLGLMWLLICVFSLRKYGHVMPANQNRNSFDFKGATLLHIEANKKAFMWRHSEV